MSSEEKRLRELLQALYGKRDTHISISPAWLATEAMNELDPAKISPDLVYRAAHLQLRQVARSICRQKFEEEGKFSEQHELFPNLQKRYPKMHRPNTEPEYVLLEHLTEDDVMYNYERLYAEAKAKMGHADALLAWWESQTGTGKLG